MTTRRQLAAALALGMLAPLAWAGDPQEAERVLRAQSDAWDRAIVAKDRAGVEGNMAPDFRQIAAGGVVVGRQAFIDDILSADLQIDPYTVEDFEVRVLGDTALLSGRIRMTGRSEGQPFKSHFRYIDIYVRRGGRWQVVSVQITPMAKRDD